MVLLAQISDLHLDGTERASARAAATAAYLSGLSGHVDALLVTGDIADHGEVAEYTETAKLLDLPFPVLYCPGNHDVRAAYRESLLGEAASDEPVNRVHRVGDVAVLMCDSTIPGKPEGALDQTTLDWIDATLTGLADDPALLAFHHPPAKMHEPLLDGWLLTNDAALAEVSRRHDNVVAVLTGHAHTAAAATFAGLPLLVSPAVTFALRLPWEDGDFANWDQPPGVAFHVVEDRRITTHFRSVV